MRAMHLTLGPAHDQISQVILLAPNGQALDVTIDPATGGFKIKD